MSRRPDGSYRCDKNGEDVGNGGIQMAVVVSRVNDNGDAEVLHFCLEPRPGYPNGCAGRVLPPANLADYEKTRPQ